MTRRRVASSIPWFLSGVALLAAACGGSGSGDAGSGGATSATTTTATGTGGAQSGSTGGGAPDDLAATLAALDADRDGTLLDRSRGSGWPTEAEGGYLFVSSDLARPNVAGDFSDWKPLAMTNEDDFAWLVVPAKPGDRYKFTDGAKDWQADPWSRVYGYDENGEHSRVRSATGARLERHFEVGGDGVAPRTVRVWVPAAKPTRVLYVHDGQNLFDPEAIWGGWKLDASAPPDTMLVGIDNTAARMDEYTHVTDDLGDGPIGGKADAYADYLHLVVRAVVKGTYGEPPIVGVMGSSLGGLVSLHVADRHPGAYRFAASLSGTMGWGSIGAGVHHETMIERIAKHGHQKTVLYVDSGGGGPCADTDADGIEDDGEGTDNYCENKQLESTLLGLGYASGVDLHHWHEPGAPHNEAAWAARVFRPLEIFAALP